MRTVTLLILAVVMTAGCNRPVGVLGAVGVTMGDLEMTRKAVRLVVQDEGAAVAVDRAAGAGWFTEARYPDGTEIAVDYERLSRSTTEITVQVGHFDRADDSERVLAAIKQQVRDLKDRAIRRGAASP